MTTAVCRWTECVWRKTIGFWSIFF